MKIAQEILTVLPDLEQREVSVLLAGFRLTLSEDEARLLIDGLKGAVARFDGREEKAAVPELSAIVGGRRTEEPAAVSLMITQAQRSALREKGYDDEAIRTMKPAEAHKLLGLAVAKK